MALAIGKRKREAARVATKPAKKVAIQAPANTAQQAPAFGADSANPQQRDGSVFVQIVTGSYERVLHGICASIPHSLLRQNSSNNAAATTSQEDAKTIAFSNTFLFAAHASSIRCLAISPPTDQQADKRYLATGSSDERINVYSLSTAPPLPQAITKLPSLDVSATAENPRNKSLGSLVNHDRAITCLHFPVRTKLVSAAEDATIAISRTRDWTVLSSIKAPIPKPQGRPSGDTAAPGEVPAGVNGFAIHPSQRLMLSVGRGERCLRLWNLMTGKKAGVLNFDRQLLAQVGEGKFSTGEGRRVLWDARGENYVVSFERGAALFGIDSNPKAIIRPSPPTKVHQMRFLPLKSAMQGNVLAMSTEDGRLLFYNIDDSSEADGSGNLPSCVCVGALGGRAAGVVGRIKDFEILHLRDAATDLAPLLLFVTGSSDGVIRMWTALEQQLSPNGASSNGSESSKGAHEIMPAQIGQLLGTLETGNRITCLGAFSLNGTPSDLTSADTLSTHPDEKNLPHDVDGIDDEDDDDDSE